jgi:uncharacterized protein (TIGR02453 family)
MESSAVPKFDHFPAATLPFLRDLAANNRRDWFAANKATYESAVKAPAEAFAATLASGLSNLAGREFRSKIFRIHRDLRFSKDKTPYNAHLHIGFAPAGAEGETACWMVGADPGRLSLGAGIFAFSPEALDRFRRLVPGQRGAELMALLDHMKSAGIRISPAELQRPPSGYPPVAWRGDLMQRKGLTVWIDSDRPGEIASPGFTARCLEGLTRLKPAVDWLDAMI